jgi:hypothetical protein
MMGFVFILVSCFLLVTQCYEIDMIETGDMIFVRPDLSPFSAFDDAILATGAATIEWMRESGDYPHLTTEVASHVAIAWRDHHHNGELSFVQALPGYGVILTSSDDFFHSSLPETTTYYHAQAIDPEVRKRRSAAASAALTQVGKPYADNFEAPPDYFYCSSLVDWSYQVALNTTEVLCPSDFVLLFFPQLYWQQYYASIHQELPVNTTGSNPTLLLHSEKMTFVELKY